MNSDDQATPFFLFDENNRGTPRRDVTVRRTTDRARDRSAMKRE
jgi:hypothetical protein